MKSAERHGKMIILEISKAPSICMPSTIMREQIMARIVS
jgi:hypothetical protein